MRWCVAIWFALQFLAAPSFARELPAVTTLSSTQTTVSGQPVLLPQRDVQLIVSRFVIAPGVTLPVHEHPSQRYADVLAGHPAVTLTDTGQTFDYQPGDFVVETRGIWHSGKAVGDQEVVLLVIDPNRDRASKHRVASSGLNSHVQSAGPRADTMKRLSRRIAGVALLTTLEACAGAARLPAPNTARARFEPQSGAVQVMVSDIAPVAAAVLLGPDGERYAAAAVTVLSGPHIAYNPPPTVGIGIGGFGFSGCCSGFGSGVGLGVPVGTPTPADVSDQYISSVVIPVPAAYAQHWSGYHVQVQLGNRALLLEAPPFASG